MNSRDTMFALQCCAPSSRAERDCASCPLNNSDDCHTQLCVSAIEALTYERGIVEHYVSEIERIHNQLSNMYVK